MARRYGVPRVHADAAALIADAGLDLVFILTPDHLHAPLLTAAIRSGRHVFVEKPVTLTDEGTDRVSVCCATAWLARNDETTMAAATRIG